MSNMYYNRKTGKWVTKRNRGYRSSRGYNRGYNYHGGYSGGGASNGWVAIIFFGLAGGALLFFWLADLYLKYFAK